MGAEFSELEELPQPAEDSNSEEAEFAGEGDRADEERGQPNEPEAPRIQMRLFAPEPEITFEGDDVGARMRGPTRRMLALLALHRGGMGTEALTDALFAHTTDSKAKGLRNTASSDARKMARAALGDEDAEILEVTQTRYQLLSDVIDVDVWRIEDLTKQARSVQEPSERIELLRVAAAEYTQELLSDVDLPWIEEKRQAFRRDAADLFVGIAKLMGDAEKALPWLERAQECDELNEAVCQEMMKAHAALERYDAVERTYRGMVARLKGMRAQPSAATNRTFQLICGRASEG